MMDKLLKNELTRIERCITSPVKFTYAPDPKGGTHAKLVRSSVSPSERKKLHDLAMRGYLAESWGSPPGLHEPPETTLTFTATALGRDACNVHAPIKPMVRSAASPTDTQLLEEANAGD